MKHNQQNIIFFDGVCNLCSSLVQFVIKRSKKGTFIFGSLQGKAGTAFIQDNSIEISAASGYTTIFYLDKGKVYTKSSAILRICRNLNRPWSWLYAFIIVPKFIRDFFYGIISKYRYNWFGKKEKCWLPGGNTDVIFLD